MIDDLDKSLQELLKRELPKSLVDQVTISFATPDDQFPPSSVKLPAIDLFLYDVRENRELRSNEWIVERNNGRAIQKPPPIRVDCSYLVTAWASESSTTPAYDEHHLLGEVMKVMLRHSTLPADILQGNLKGQEPPLPTAALQPGQLQSMGEFWQALGGKPKAALNYTVTIGVQPFEAIEVPVVLEKIIAMKPDVKE
jgi:hypothetical protein